MMVTIVTETIIYDKAYFTVCALLAYIHLKEFLTLKDSMDNNRQLA
jgi:hypothetical protein